MTNLRHLVAVVLVSLLGAVALPPTVFAQEEDESECEGTPLVCWLEETGFLVRESFSNPTDAAKPAVVSFVDPHVGTDHYQVDIALARKFDRWEHQDLFFFPSLEWHRATEDDQDFNRLKGAFNLEYYIGGGRSPDEWRPMIFTLAEIGAERDLEEDVTTGIASLLATLYKPEPWWPGDLIRDKNGALLGRYYPFVGLEYYENLALPDDAGEISAGFGVARVQVEWFPFNRDKLLSETSLEINLIYTLRYGWSDDELEDRAVDLWEIGASYYLDDARRVAIGLEYESGRNPKNSFDERTSTVVALKFKLGEAP